MVSHFVYFFGSIALILSLFYDKMKELDKSEWFKEQEIQGGLGKIEEFDFIIVLLLEAGGDPVPQTEISNYYPHFNPHPNLTYQWTSTEQKNSCLDQPGAKTTMAQGRSLGGSSSINTMQYNRGSPEDYNNWARITRDDSWSYSNILKFFQMSENYHQDFAGETMGVGGPMVITHCDPNFNKIENDMNIAWRNAGKELGYDYFDNPNGPQREGFTSFHETKRMGRRVSTYNSFIQPAIHRKNLKIMRYSVVEKIDFDENGQAIGVFFKKHGIDQYARARKEIILSAGALNSPLILMNSGIGPKDQLQNASIPVIVDSPVGQHFQDHTAVPLNLFDIKNDFDLEDPNDSIDTYVQNGTGIMSKIFYTLGHGFIETKASKNLKGPNAPQWPDIQFMNLAFAKNIPGIEREINIYQIIALVRPTSFGTAQLDPQDSKLPLIWNPNYLANQFDRDRLIQGVKLALKIADSKWYANANLRLKKTTKYRHYSKCSHFAPNSPKYFECLIAHLADHFFHPTGTCRMGQITDRTAIVDPKLKVIGVKGLRVIDNSIQPTITNANTNSVAIMIGQKGADMIIKEWESEKSKTVRKPKLM